MKIQGQQRVKAELREEAHQEEPVSITREAALFYIAAPKRHADYEPVSGKERHLKAGVENIARRGQQDEQAGGGERVESPRLALEQPGAKPRREHQVGAHQRRIQPGRRHIKTGEHQGRQPRIFSFEAEFGSQEINHCHHEPHVGTGSHQQVHGARVLEIGLQGRRDALLLAQHHSAQHGRRLGRQPRLESGHGAVTEPPGQPYKNVGAA